MGHDLRNQIMIFGADPRPQYGAWMSKMWHDTHRTHVFKSHHSVAMDSHDVALAQAQTHIFLGFRPYLSILTPILVLSMFPCCSDQIDLYLGI